MVQVLAAHQNLEEIRDRVAQERQRLCFIATWEAGFVERDCLYLKPGAKEYVKCSNLEAYLSMYQGWNTCVLRENGVRYFDLEAAYLVRLLFPIYPGEQVPNYSAFEASGVEGVTHQQVFIENLSEVPRELEPFIVTGKECSRYRNRSWINFASSGPIQRPLEVRDRWHAAAQGKGFTVLQPPGQYAGPHVGTAEKYNRLARCECDPGPCVVCHGEKLERRHFGVLAFGPDAYLLNHVCLSCLDESFRQIRKLVEGA